MNRKEFLKLVGLVGINAATSLSNIPAALAKNTTFNEGHDLQYDVEENLAPFYHGVASGDPTQSDVLLWTRISPEHTHKNTISVTWLVSTDSKQENIIQQGKVSTDSSKDYTIKTVVKDLAPDTYYWYSFTYGDKKSLIGRTKTLPANPDEVNLVAISCNAYESGYFSAFEVIADKQEKIDAVLHLGDFIYEDFNPKYIGIKGRAPMPHKRCVSLEDYRTRYAQYRLDKQLRKAMQMHPFIHIWDDHEIANNDYMHGAEPSSHDPDKDGSWNIRKKNGVKAYFEWVPIKNDETKLYREVKFGELLTILMLEDRLDGRTKQEKMSNPDFYSENRHMLGRQQMNWLTSQLKNRSVSMETHWQSNTLFDI